MSVSHLKSNIIGDFTGTVTVFNSAGATQTANATDLVRPTDWNSAHAQLLTLSGNTAGSSNFSGTNIVWAGGSNVTLSGATAAGAATVSIIAAAGGGAAGTNTLGASNLGNTAGTSGVITGTALQLVFAGGNNITLSQSVNAASATITISGPNTIAQSVQTQASGNIAGVGFSSATTAGAALVGTLNSAGLSVGVPAWLTTAAQSNHSHNLATTTTNGSVAVVATANSAGATVAFPPWITTYAAQSVQTQASGNIAGVGTTFAGTNVTATVGLNSAGLALSLSAGGGGGAAADGVNILQAGTVGTTGTTFSASTGTVFLNGSNNITISQNASNQLVVSGPTLTQYLTTAQPVGAYLTTARASNDAIGLNTALTANGLSVTANSSGLSINVPAWLTTAALSNHSHNFATTTTNGSVAVVATTNSAGATVAMPPWITTYAAQTNQTVASGNIAGVGTTFAGTNITATVGLNSAGLALSLSGGGGGTINQTGPNIAVAGSTVTSGDVYFSNSPTVTFGMAGSTITASAAGGGGGAATVGGWEPFPPLGGNTAFSTGGLGTIYFQKIIPQANISFNNIERRISGSTVSSAISAQAAHTISYGLYSLGTGASTSIYNLIASSSMFFQASYSSNLSAGHTISQGAGSYTASSAGTVGQGNLTGFKHCYFPFTSTLTAGGLYAVGMVMSSATTGATGPLRLGLMELSVINNLTVGKLYASTVLATAASFVGDYAQGVYSSSSNGLPATLAISGLTNAVSQQRMYLQFEV
jgi:hypothetical protein